MQSLDTKAFDIINTNLGVFGSTAQPMVNGKEEVFDALRDFVNAAGIDCTLLTSGLCEVSAVGSISPSVSATYSPTETVETSSPSLSSSPSSSTYEPTNGASGLCQSASDEGLPSKTGDVSQPLLGNAYTPTSNVDHMYVCNLLTSITLGPLRYNSQSSLLPQIIVSSLQKSSSKFRIQRPVPMGYFGTHK